MDKGRRLNATGQITTLRSDGPDVEMIKKIRGEAYKEGYELAMDRVDSLIEITMRRGNKDGRRDILSLPLLKLIKAKISYSKKGLDSEYLYDT